MVRRSDSRGFSLAEMLVAIAIAAVGLIPIMEMESRTAKLHATQIEAAERLTAERTAIALVRDINPAMTPEGTSPIGLISSMKWHATPISRPKRALRFLGGPGEFDITLFRLDVAIDHPKHQFSVDRIGWRPTVLASPQ
jgi:prepilin-type N-terminal cleavage/methylation domain-containing protein